jgi:hypothetical protein
MTNLSARTAHLTMTFNENPLAVGSGLFARHGGQDFLVTVRHNLAGRDFERNAILHKRGVTPDSVTVRMRAVNPAIGWVNKKFALLDGDDVPLWFEPLSGASQSDIAVLPIAVDADAQVESWQLDRPQPAQEPTISAAQELFVVGYPRGFAYHVNMPVWSRASVASEPSIPYQGRPVFLIDSKTTRGQSGAPVILRPRWHEPVRMADGSTVEAVEGDAWVTGVYSGRVRKGMQIGMVWRLPAIVDAIESRTSYPSTGRGQPVWRVDFDADNDR